MSGVPEWARYRTAENAATSCATCDFFINGYCEMFETHVAPEMTCDRWSGRVAKDDIEPGAQHSDLDVAAMAAAIRQLEPVHVFKGQAKPNALNLHVVGVHRAPA